MVVIVGVFVATGVIVGLIWPRLVPQVDMVMVPGGPLPGTEQDAAQLMSMDAWYAILGGGAALLVGAVLGATYIRFGMATAFALLVGAALAAAVALVVGTMSVDGEVLLAWEPQVPNETKLTAPLMLHAYGVLLVWPIAALAPLLPLAWLGWEDGNPKSNRTVSNEEPEGQR